MSAHRPPPVPALDALEDALALLREHGPTGDAAPPAEPLPSLLERCEALVAEAASAGPEPLRTVHHFACSGGTLICRCIAALPNTVLLSEIDPLSTNRTAEPGGARFAPTDLILQLRQSRHPVDPAMLVAVFRAGLDRLHGLLAAEGRHLVLRDHPHSRFCTDVDAAARPGLRDMLRPDHRLLSVVTVRHPLESFLSLEAADWVHFSPATLEDYARRYHAFLDDHADLPVIRYEEFLADPETVLSGICARLALPFDRLALTLQAGLVLTGDSGRAGGTIAPRPRRPIPEPLRAQMTDSPSYEQLCTRLDYDPSG